MKKTYHIKHKYTYVYKIISILYIQLYKIILDISNDSRSTALSSECIASRSGEGYLNLKIAAITLVRLQDGH